MEDIIFSGAMTFMLLGIFTGALFPLLGNTGAYMVVPLLLVVTGLSPESAVPLGLAHMAALIVPSAVNKWQSGNLDLKLMFLATLGMLPGIFLGSLASDLLQGFNWYNHITLIPYLILLTGTLIYRFKPFRVLPKPGNPLRRKLLRSFKKLPTKTFLTTCNMSVPAILLVLMGVLYAFVGKLFGPIAALMLSPLFIVLLDIPAMVAIGTSVVANLLGMLAIALSSDYMLLPINLQILLWLFLGSSITILLISGVMHRRPYPVPIAALFVIITSVTLWALVASEPSYNLLLQHFSFPINLLGYLGGDWV